MWITNIDLASLEYISVGNYAFQQWKGCEECTVVMKSGLFFFFITRKFTESQNSLFDLVWFLLCSKCVS